jgi:hypothetical protein
MTKEGFKNKMKMQMILLVFIALFTVVVWLHWQPSIGGSSQIWQMPHWHTQSQNHAFWEKTSKKIIKI